MKRFPFAATVAALLTTAVVPTAYAVDFDELRRENLDKDAKYEELRRGYREGVKAVDFDQLRRENRDQDAIDFDDLRRHNLDKDAT